MVAKRSHQPLYLADIADADLPFHRVEDWSHVATSHSTRGRALFYLTRWGGAHTESFKLSDDVIRKQALECLAALHRGFDPDAAEAVHVHRVEMAEPIPTLSGLKRKPPLRLGESDVYLCTSAQAYPRAPGLDACVVQARETTARLLRDRRG